MCVSALACAYVYAYVPACVCNSVLNDYMYVRVCMCVYMYAMNVRVRGACVYVYTREWFPVCVRVNAGQRVMLCSVVCVCMWTSVRHAIHKF